MFLVDIHGLVYRSRTVGMNPYLERFANGDEPLSLAEVMKGTDVFLGVSVAGIVNQEMVRSMADRPILFALANPDPEISYEEAAAARDDIIIGTGRSDFPNQVNNVLGFPFIFRGALDVRARAINDEMKIAAVRALADLAREDVPDSVIKAYGDQPLLFGRDYIIPKPFDPRVLIREASAVARAAIESGVARRPIEDFTAYEEHLESLLGKAREIMRQVINKARRAPKRIVYPEGWDPKILRACQHVIEEGIARPILCGRREKIEERCNELNINLEGVEIIYPVNDERLENYAQQLYRLRARKGMTYSEARMLLRGDWRLFGAMMVRTGDADSMLAGVSLHYPDTIRPALQVIPLRKGFKIVAGLYMMVFKHDVFFFADTTVNIEPDSEELAAIAIMAADEVRNFDIKPRIAMLSFGNFGSTRHPLTEKVAAAVRLVQEQRPDLIIDGEMMADTAVTPEILESTYDFNRLRGRANVLIFPDLAAGNIAYKLMNRLGGAEAIGPILMGMSKSIHVLQRNCEVKDIVNMSAVAVLDAGRNVEPE